MTEEPKQPFKNILAEFAKSQRPNAADCEHLKRWADDHRADEVWSKISHGIRKRGGVEPIAFAYYFIQEILSLRAFALNPGARPAYLERAKDAERLARFLSGSPGL